MADDSDDWSALVAAQENEVDVKVITSLFYPFLLVRNEWSHYYFYRPKVTTIFIIAIFGIFSRASFLSILCS